MKIALIGYGKMGKLIEQEALTQGLHIAALFSRHLGKAQERPQELALADVVIDFSHASAVLDNLQLCLSLGKPLVIGTTGWEEHLPKARGFVEEAGGSAMYAPNFSIGFYLYQQVLNYAAALFQPFNAYDVCGIEYHHNQKLDAPSGTAKGISKNMLQKMPRLNSLNFSSVRCGHMPGTHTIHFDSVPDTLTFTHQARNRLGFAQGALTAAKWLAGKRGFFTIDDMMQHYMKGAH